MADANLAFQGISLAHHAAVQAALAEGHPLEEVLRVEHLSPGDWASADAAFKASLASDAELSTQHRLAFEQAADALGRRIEPIDYDVVAWLSFFRAWSFDPTPAETLAKLGLRSSDIARLQRLWARRASQDLALQKRLNEFAVQPLPPPPMLSVGPMELRPSRFVGTKLAADAAPELELADYATVRAELALYPEEATAILTERGLDPNRDWDAGWRALLERDPALHRDFRALYSHFHGRLAARKKSGLGRPVVPQRKSVAPVPEPAAPGPLKEIRGTVLGNEGEARGPALPFAPPPAPPPPTGGARAAAKSMRRTAEAVDGPLVPSLPFRRDKPAETDAPTLPRPLKQMRGTALVNEAEPRGPALPFAQPTPAVTEAPAAAAVSATPVSSLPHTPDAIAGPLAPALPFVREQSAEPALPTLAQGHAKISLEKAQPAASVLRTTKRSADALPAASGVLVAPAEPVLDFAATVTSEGHSQPPVPQRGPPPAPAIAPMSIEQHASLSFELSIAPAQESATLARYQITAETRASADMYWRERRTADSAIDAAWRGAYDTYAAWFLNRRGT